MNHYVYGLVDPITLGVRYVGYTSITPEKRLSGHIYDAMSNNKNDGKGEWIRSLCLNGNEPMIIVLQSTPIQQQAILAERWWIAHGQMIGWDLLNERHITTRTSVRERRRYVVVPVVHGEKRPLTEDESNECRSLHKSGMSKNALCVRFYGSKNARYIEWITIALDSGT